MPYSGSDYVRRWRSAGAPSLRRKSHWVRRTRDVRRAANDCGHVPRQKRPSAWCKMALVSRTGFLVAFGPPRAASRDREITARFSGAGGVRDSRYSMCSGEFWEKTIGNRFRENRSPRGRPGVACRPDRPVSGSVLGTLGQS
jgi:hypothetical protein